MRCYANDAQTQRDLNGRSLEQALDDFTQATHGALKNLGKTLVVWEGVAYLFVFAWGALTPGNVFFFFQFCLGII